MKILIADDELVSRRRLQALLTTWGHDVVSAEDGNSAFELLKGSDGPRLGLLDWMMPGMNGVDVSEPYVVKDLSLTRICSY